ncbi:hypothetical protein [Marinibacterium sp. SX1]|uniref:hypothetical protein n=1 Tax=Marinibacterium sp. SX1 TaxID=3388424 RepID=UPI003D1809AD
MMNIQPDPAHPRGGYARLSLAADAVQTPAVSITLRNSFNEKYLGQKGWQSEKAFFGPYNLEPDGDRVAFVVGTEIVNQVEEYTALVIEIGDQSFEVSWPDDIKQGPPAATVGGVSATPPKASGGTGPNLVGKAKETPPAADTVDTIPEDPPAPPVREAQPETPPPTARIPDPDAGPARRRTAPIAAVVLLALLAAGAAYWALSRPGPEPVAVVEEEPEPVAEVAAPADPCSEDGLNASTADGYGGLVDQLQACGGAVSADAALGLIELGVDANDPAALATLGRLYDQAVEIAVVETDMGLTFADNPARSAEYYSRAISAGDGVGAAENLAAVCERLSDATDTLSQGARQDFCAK